MSQQQTPSGFTPGGFGGTPSGSQQNTQNFIPETPAPIRYNNQTPIQGQGLGPFQTPMNTQPNNFTPQTQNNNSVQNTPDANNPQLNNRSKVSLQGRPEYQKKNLAKVNKVVDRTIKQVSELFITFIQDFVIEETEMAIYRNQLLSLPSSDSSTLYIDFTHLSEHNSDLAAILSSSFHRYEPVLNSTITEYAKGGNTRYQFESNNDVVTTDLHRDLFVAFRNFPKQYTVRDLKNDRLGELLAVTGTVTRTTEVRPELVSGTFRCNLCNTIVHDVVQQFKYTEPDGCPNLGGNCTNQRSWILLPHKSKFADWQKVRIQENPNAIPSGSMPRSFDVIVRNEMVERAKPGDKIVATGALIVVPDVSQINAPGARASSQKAVQFQGTDGLGGQGVTGLKSLGARDLSYKMAFLANNIKTTEIKNSTIDFMDDEAAETQQHFLDTLSQQDRDELDRECEHPYRLYNKMVQSIAPSVFGHLDIKRGVLLQMLGGVHKVTPTGMNLRGDINLCIVGDPSTSKSQFLKYVTSFVSRSVFTSGKASSAAGLTASVIRDEDTGDFTIEAGALMLADQGICAIDEFDKMNYKDQVAIHEAMEQQTISIAKAGVQATLNARTSILAAANPVGGRYNPRLTLRQNINMSAPIMSRFDLFFVVMDVPDPEADAQIGKHIIDSHRFLDNAVQPPIRDDLLKKVIALARLIKPTLTSDAKEALSRFYVELRNRDATGLSRNTYRVTVRQLESMLRLSEAIARANLSQEIQQEHVEEAYRLLKRSIVKVVEEDVIQDTQIFHPATKNLEASGMEVESSGISEQIVIAKEQYNTIRQLLLLLLNQKFLDGSDSQTRGTLRSDLVQAYLSTVIDDFTDLDFVRKESQLARAVLHQLVHVEKIMLEVDSSTLPDSFMVENQGLQPEANDPVLILHPSFSYDNGEF